MFNRFYMQLIAVRNGYTNIIQHRTELSSHILIGTTYLNKSYLSFQTQWGKKT